MSVMATLGVLVVGALVIGGAVEAGQFTMAGSGAVLWIGLVYATLRGQEHSS